MYKYYYQIDYIDKDGLALYVDAYKNEDFKKAKERVNYLNVIEKAIRKGTKFVLDKYRYVEGTEDTDEVITMNITGAI